MSRFLFFVLIVLIVSCKEAVQTATSLAKVPEEPVLVADQGSYFTLDKDAVSIYLPDTFEKYSISEYEYEVKKINDSIDDPFVSLFTNLRDNLKGKFYLLYDKDNYSFCAVNSIPYFDFKRQDAKYMLAMIRKNQQDASGPDLFFEKQTAKYSATDDVKIFKAVFKLSNFDETLVNYRHIYLISTRNNQTFQFIFNTPFEADFDPFIRRMKI
ncbi:MULTISPECIES: hypothetical protein [unclassified Leeuwenhoekiella]|mgnify:CR=1 FL=1|uniref:hypothetical protein n=1 Tax=unclassified Leeuwenhoekiella TaxID=2615029 RepID=UPI000C36AC39|nr:MULTISPECIES: hypothetical protein [unclassified Leeuwenhoekiella]MAW95047.1 hypothetical protein [Leeuwenhoekiella sp.]MBA79767.1 hypothetical protein [Leeuwenhoekiella sp.]|tara:strand:+ start:3339 stop:3974 length:636 start_codon:yes stop_codon:yes gene_type:complete